MQEVKVTITLKKLSTDVFGPIKIETDSPDVLLGAVMEGLAMSVSKDTIMQSLAQSMIEKHGRNIEKVMESLESTLLGDVLEVTSTGFAAAASMFEQTPPEIREFLKRQFKGKKTPWE